MSEVYTVIDFETTGLDYKTEHIIEIAALKVTEDGREIGRLNTFVALEEGRELPPFITELTGITSDDLIGGLHEYVALAILADFIANSTVVAQNVPFDLSFIEGGYVGSIGRFMCTRTMAKLIDPTESSSLKNVCARYDIELNGHHRAMNDVLATWNVFKTLKPIADERRIEYRNTVIDSAERPLTYIPNGAQVIKID